MVRVALVMGTYPGPERERRADLGRSYSGGDLEVGIIEVPASPYKGLMTPLDGALGHPVWIEGYRQAEKEGYDAAVPLGTLDLGVDGGRSAVDIPIVGALEAALLAAVPLGDRFGMICYRPESMPWARARARYYGFGDRIVSIRTTDMSMTEYTNDKEGMRKNFLAAGHALVADGAEVVIPAGISQCPIHMSPAEVAEELGVPVVDPVGAPIHVAAALVRLGLKTSRVRFPLGSS